MLRKENEKTYILQIIAYSIQLKFMSMMKDYTFV